MSNSPDSEKPAARPAQERAAIDVARRKLSMGLGASAVFTLASRPVLAGQCMTPSAAASGNLSHHGTPPTCTGRTVAQWVALANGNNNPNNGFPGGNVVFNSVFANGNGINWPNGSNGRLYRVMTAPSNANSKPQPNPISAEFAAALLNIRGGFVPPTVLNDVGLIGMWNEWKDTGVFTPKAGATWDANQIVAYLRTLQA